MIDNAVASLIFRLAKVTSPAKETNCDHSKDGGSGCGNRFGITGIVTPVVAIIPAVVAVVPAVVAVIPAVVAVIPAVVAVIPAVVAVIPAVISTRGNWAWIGRILTVDTASSIAAIPAKEPAPKTTATSQ